MTLLKPAAVLAVAMILIGADAARAQPSDEKRGGRVGGPWQDAPISAAVEATDAGRLSQAPVTADPVWNGIAAGAAIGTAAGLGLVAYLYSKCDDNCDAPEPGPIYLTSAAMGAGVGALVGWAADAARKSSNRRVSFGASLTPRYRTVRIAVRF